MRPVIAAKDRRNAPEAAALGQPRLVPVPCLQQRADPILQRRVIQPVGIEAQVDGFQRGRGFLDRVPCLRLHGGAEGEHGGIGAHRQRIVEGDQQAGLPHPAHLRKLWPGHPGGLLFSLVPGHGDRDRGAVQPGCADGRPHIFPGPSRAPLLCRARPEFININLGNNLVRTSDPLLTQTKKRTDKLAWKEMLWIGDPQEPL